MKIYGSISAETMAQHEWVMLDDYLAEMGRIRTEKPCSHDWQTLQGVPTCRYCGHTLRELNP